MARRCSFCGEDRRGVERLVAGTGGVAICGDCARLAVELTASPSMDQVGDLLLTRIGCLVTNDPRRGGYLGILEEAAVAIRQGRVTWVGAEKALPVRYRELPELDCRGRLVTPGFVDAHRHLAADFEGDLPTMSDVVSSDVAVTLEQGATTVDLRVWGAPIPEVDVTVLSAIRSVGETTPIDLIPTLVVGEGRPSDAYRELLESVLFPTAARVADYLDVVVGDALDTTDARAVAELGRRHGMRPRFHVEDLDGLEAAIESRAVSVDGMWEMGEAAPVVAESGLAMVGMPGTSWMLGWRDSLVEMWEAGAVVALGSCCEGGGVPTMPMAMAAAVYHGELDPAQALWSATRGSALALEEPEKGMVSSGAVADLVVVDGDSIVDLVAEPGRDPVARVVKDGTLLGT